MQQIAKPQYRPFIHNYRDIYRLITKVVEVIVMTDILMKCNMGTDQVTRV